LKSSTVYKVLFDGVQLLDNGQTLYVRRKIVRHGVR